MIKVTFKDEGQDFLEWYIKDGVVVDCQPFQGWLWKGKRTLPDGLRPGDKIRIEGPDGPITLIHPIEKIELVA